MIRYDPESPIYRWNGNRMDLAEEYRDNLRGPYSLELQKILDRMRTTPMQGRFALIVVEPFKRWQLAKLSGIRGVPPEVVDHAFYTSMAEAEWDLFKRRWETLSGIPVTI